MYFASLGIQSLVLEVEELEVGPRVTQGWGLEGRV